MKRLLSKTFKSKPVGIIAALMLKIIDILLREENLNLIPAFLLSVSQMFPLQSRRSCLSRSCVSAAFSSILSQTH